MSTPTWGLDPKARRISVYFEGETTIYEGMPVCYNYDTTDNWLGVASIDFTSTASTITESGTTAEGSQNEGKFIRVERPVNGNLLHFAGVVAGADHEGETGPKAIDIYVPNGAIVPVRCDVDTTSGTTILSIAEGEEELGLHTGNSTTRAVGIAMETETALDGTAGITLCKLDPNLFMNTNLDGTALIMAAAGTSNYGALHTSNITSAQTGGYCTNMLLQTTITGDMTDAAGGGACGLMCLATTTGTYDQDTGIMYVRSVLGATYLTGSTYDNQDANITGGHFQVTGACTLTDLAVLSCVWADSQMDDTGQLSGSASNVNKCLTLFRGTNNGHATLTSFISLYGNTAIQPGKGGVLYLLDLGTCYAAADELNACVINGGDGGAEKGIATTSGWKKIRIRVEGTEYWLVAYSAPTEVDMVT